MRVSRLFGSATLACAAAVAIAAGCKSSTASGNAAGPSQGAADAGSSVARDVGQGAGTAAGEVASGVKSAGQGIADAGAAAAGAASETAGGAAQGAGSAATTAADAARQAASSAKQGYQEAMDAGPATPAAPVGPTDAQIAAIAHAANQGDILKSQLAKKISKNKKVRAFANLMIKDHTALDGEAQKLGISPEDNDTSRSLQQGAQEALDKLQSQKGKEFDVAYVDNEVSSHQKVLQSIDDTLIPNAKDAGLKALLQKAREKVAHHLEMAQKLQSSLAR